jgi:hypothetical protein
MPLRSRNSFARTTPVFLVMFLFAATLATSQTAITTYHVDNNRTGWNFTRPCSPRLTSALPPSVC